MKSNEFYIGRGPGMMKIASNSIHFVKYKYKLIHQLLSGCLTVIILTHFRCKQSVNYLKLIIH